MIQDPIIRDIPGYEKLYQISENGEIYNMKTEKCKKQTIGKRGYYIVSLWKKNKGKLYYTHRILADIFINNKHNYEYVDHIDRNKLNNNLSNLRWCTHSENCRNIGVSKNSKSGILGVHPYTGGLKKDKWQASVYANGVKYNKRFPYDDNGLKEAIDWHKNKKKELHGEFST